MIRYRADTCKTGIRVVSRRRQNAARNPMYSSWYVFHRKIQAKVLEEECIRAKALGMDTVIVDDGWQTADSGGRYGHTGDWEPCSEKIPDMRAHVRRVHETGMIEFRQSYIGPGMRRFGNMFRVSDCASDIATNRAGIVDLRILSGNMYHGT